MGNAPGRQQGIDVRGDHAAAEQPVRHRLAAQHRLRERDGPRSAARVDAQAFTKRRHFRPRRLRLARIVGERGDMDGGQLAQRLEHVPASYPVAAVGRPGRAVDQEQDFGHRAGQPNPRAIIGPMRLAAHSGSFFHRSTCNRYLALFGLVSRGASPGASQRA